MARRSGNLKRYYTGAGKPRLKRTWHDNEGVIINVPAHTHVFIDGNCQLEGCKATVPV